jgi:asparagine synthase (glutamine-hydrolysing)
MCGIAGVFGGHAVSDRLELLRHMAQAMEHRGPDDQGFYEDEPLALAFRRLAILDLSPAGHQPMATPDQKHWIVFNGEIYNHLEIRKALDASGHHPLAGWGSSSDTETLLTSLVHLGLEKTLPRLQGMFAFAWWDSENRRLSFARDRFGKKPLFRLRTSGGGLAFASEIKTLLRHPDCRAMIDPQRLPAYLAYRYLPGHETLVEGIEPLPPGHYEQWHLDGIRVTSSGPVPWWAPQFGVWPISKQALSPDEATEQMDLLLRQAVEARLLSDVPLGAFLSGGLDSSVVVAMMAHLRPAQPPVTFSIGFDTGFSEHHHARKVADLFGAQHHEIVVDSASLRQELPRALHHREGPITEPSDVPLSLLCELARRDVTVVLSGEGSDELFAGYPKHRIARWVPDGIRPVLAPLAGLALRGLGHQPRAATVLRALSAGNLAESEATWFGAFSPRERAELLQSHLNAPTHGFVNNQLAHLPALSPLDRTQQLDCLHWLPANLLQRADRLTMGHSLELRCPFLDVRLAHFAHQLPPSLRLRGLKGKWLLRRVARRYLPHDIIERRKWGFKVPVGTWFRGPLREELRSALLDPQAHLRQWLRPQALERFFHDHDQGRVDHSKRLWTLWQLEAFSQWLAGGCAVRT